MARTEYYDALPNPEEWFPYAVRKWTCEVGKCQMHQK